MNNLKPYYCNTNNCLQNALGIILKWKNLNPFLMYADSLNFGYNAFLQPFSQRIFPYRDKTWFNYEIFNLLSSLYGINVKIYQNRSFNFIFNLVKKELNKNTPVIIEIDVFYCRWHVSYRKYHLPHSCLINKLDYNSFSCIITDKRINENYEGKIYFEDIKESLISCMTFNFSNNTIINNYNKIIKNTCNNTLLGVNGISDYKYMRDCSIDLINDCDFKEEIDKHEDVWGIPLIRCFGWVRWGRINFYNFLSFLDKNEVSVTIHKFMFDMLKESVVVWGTLQNTLIKNALLNNEKLDNKNISNMIKEVASIEESLAEKVVETY